MTTIVANLECMAADTRVTIGDCVPYHANKIFRIGESLYGTAGDGMMGLIFIDWVKRGKKSRLELYKHWSDYERAEFWVLELNSQGLFSWDGWGVPEKLNDQRYSIGSGQKAALAHYDEHKSCEAAVRCAAGLDPYTAAPIQVEYLLPPELSRRKRR